MGKTLTIDEANFKKEVLDSQEPVLLDFWAEWCPPCRALAPVLDELSEAYAGKLKIGKVDAEANQGLASAYQVSAMPTLLLFKGGRIANAVVGFRARQDLVKLLEGAL